MSTTTPAEHERPVSMLPPAVQQRLQQVFQHAKRSYEKGDVDYAHDLFSQCVSEDPTNLTYAQHFRANLAKKHGDATKKSGSFGGLLTKTGRGAIDKAAAKGKWQDAFAAGCQALKKNPGDIGALQALAAASGAIGAVECQLYYLRWALDVDPKQIETNRQAAGALAGVKQFDQAIACWQRVLQQKPLDEEASKQVSRLSVEKTIAEGGYKADVAEQGAAAADISTARVADLAAKESDGTPREVKRDDSPEEETPAESFEAAETRLTEAITESPADIASHVQLAELYTAESRLQDAERVLKQAISKAPDDTALRDKIEDIHLRRVREQVETAKRRYADSNSDDNRALLKRMTDQANRAELEVYTARAKRSPGDSRLHFELGLRQKRLGQFREAIQSFQAARGDSQRLAETQILLGECFQHIEKYKLAMSSYDAAIEAAAAAKEETLKLALYRAGVLAMGLKEYTQADERLTRLAGLDFSYRDVSERLDKVAAMRNDA